MPSSQFSGTELPWTGGRPWRIHAYCEATAHNTLNAARGRFYTHVGGKLKIIKTTKCICPGARAAIEKDNEGRRARSALEKELAARSAAPRIAQGAGERRTGREGAWVPDGVHMPDMSEGKCNTLGLLGRRIMDKAIDSPGPAGVSQAKGVCNLCPIKEKICGPYVRAAEKPAGSWAGVWAGLTPAERRRANIN